LVFDGNNQLTRRYLHGPTIDQVLAEEISGQTYWTLSDHQGTIRDWLTSAGVVQKHIRYHSFGRTTQQTGTLSNRFWYTGREWDGEIGLYFYRARYYDPLVGRFVGEDPIGFEARDANLYRYVLNSSPNATDPMGLFVPPPAPVLPGIGLLRPLL
jgi:RHS repeat-associated protein